MIDQLLQIIAPHHCYGCDKLGQTLCENCKYDIVSDLFSGCIECRQPTNANGICRRCKTEYDKAWVVGERNEILKNLLDGYKFQRQRQTYKILAKLLDETLPVFPAATVVVPIPTISGHIRQRGYDHMRLVAKELARLRKLTYSELLVHKTNTKQLGSSRRDRIAHAKVAYAVKPRETPSGATPYVLVDDVYTTGSTLQYAARTLREGGAEVIWAAVVARQPLD